MITCIVEGNAISQEKMTCLTHTHTHTEIPPHLENRNRKQEPQNNEQASYQHEIVKVYFEQMGGDGSHTQS